MLSTDSNLCPLSGSLIPENIIRQQFSIIYTTDCGSKWNCVVQHMSFMAEKRDMHHFQSALTLSCNFLPWRWMPRNTILHFFETAVLDHMSASTTQPLSKWLRKILLPPSSITVNLQWLTAHMWHTDFHSACVESTFHGPSTSLAVQ